MINAQNISRDVNKIQQQKPTPPSAATKQQPTFTTVHIDSNKHLKPTLTTIITHNVYNNNTANYLYNSSH